MTSKDSSTASSKGLAPGFTARGGLSTRSRTQRGGPTASGDLDGQLSEGGQQDQEFIQALGRQQGLGGEQGRSERQDLPEGEESRQERRERWTCDAAIVRKDLANLPRLTATNFDAWISTVGDAMFSCGLGAVFAHAFEEEYRGPVPNLQDLQRND